MMKDDEIEEQIKHVKKNLLFFSLYWDELVSDKKSKASMMKTIDYLLDKLIELLKKK